MRYVNRSIFNIAVLILGSVFLSSCTTTTPTRTTMDSASIYESGAMPAAVRGATYHTVAPGETLWRIGKMYDVEVEELIRANSISNPERIEIGQEIYVPGASARKNVVSLYPSRKWKYIIIHHSATDTGNSMQFNKAHLARGWKGVGYHFVIDNGTYGKDDGQIETGPRWIKQERGAHCKAGNMNEQGIGICLVGNFSEGKPTRRQMDSLVYLVNKLRKYYHISKRRIMGHGQVTGARTECPGTRFPWKTFWSKLDRS